MRSLLLSFLHQNTELWLGNHISNYTIFSQIEKQFSLLHCRYITIFSYVQVLPCMYMELAEWLVHWAPKLASRVRCSTRCMYFTTTKILSCNQVAWNKMKKKKGSALCLHQHNTYWVSYCWLILSNFNAFAEPSKLFTDLWSGTSGLMKRVQWKFDLIF